MSDNQAGVQTEIAVREASCVRRERASAAVLVAPDR